MVQVASSVCYIVESTFPIFSPLHCWYFDCARCGDGLRCKDLDQWPHPGVSEANIEAVSELLPHGDQHLVPCNRLHPSYS